MDMAADTYEVVILGAGPAGLQAAIHAARAKVSVLVLGRGLKSSLFRAHVENYCCLAKVAGQDLLEGGRRQAEASGAAFSEEDVVETESQDAWYLVKLESGREIKCRALILAMGISRNKLGVPGEKELLGKGVSYCVDCDAGFYKGETVAVAGCESAAVAGALTLLFYASEVHLICPELAVSQILAKKLRQSAITLHEGRQVKEIRGEQAVENLVLDDGALIPVAGVFIEQGAKGAIQLAATLGVALDPEKFQYVLVDKVQATNLAGVYAAGDICGPPWQVAKAVGQGCVAGLEAAAYVKKLR
jgi:thioredoxin reductase (NADPH)